ncbi:DUF1848 domain-containing protein [Emergencia timonensis]|uniref:DUF1848 domain-containing protein n=1 Tax=Emergencia timonensis TaxID=1776384 RepID=UPI003995D402
MILNTGNRTDIPAYYSKWFYNRIREGFVFARNPYNQQQVTRYLLDPEVVDCISFCTKNPAPMLPGLAQLSAFRQFWAVTITPYGRDIEPRVPAKEVVMESFCCLSEKVGLNRISWRYDPIFITEKYSLEFHLKTFAEMAAALAGYTDHCVISFLDLYDKTKRNFPEGRSVNRQERFAIGEAFAAIGKEHGMTIKTCAEGAELEVFGVDTGGCQSKEVLERAIGLPLIVPGNAMTRSECSCVLGSDIGAYNTCGHGCLYCYANYDQDTVESNMGKHDPFSPFLIGDFMDGDIIKAAEQESWIQRQVTFDFL